MSHVSETNFFILIGISSFLESIYEFLWMSSLNLLVIPTTIHSPTKILFLQEIFRRLFYEKKWYLRKCITNKLLTC